MMKIKKILLLFGGSLLLVFLIGFMIIVNNNSKIVIGLIDNISSNLVTYLDNKTISGATKFNLNVDSIFGDNKIIEDKTDLVICDYYKYYEDGRKEVLPMIPHYDKNDKKSEESV